MKAVKLSDEAIEIALKHGKTVNQGLLNIGIISKETHDKEYWRQFKTELESMFERYR